MQVSPCSLGHLDEVFWEKIYPVKHSLAGLVPFNPRYCKKGVGVAVLRVFEAPSPDSAMEHPLLEPGRCSPGVPGSCFPLIAAPLGEN